MRLEKLFGRKDRLPLNRKERYYTATVLPGIVCSDGLARFLKLLERPNVVADLTSAATNVQFFTEYDLRDAIRGRQDSPHEELRQCLSGDSPDLVILIEASLPLLLVVEAKLFSATTTGDIVSQIGRQKKFVVEPLKRIIGACDAIQVALVPQSLANDVRVPPSDSPEYRTLTWEEIAQDYADVASAAYWVQVLRYALGQQFYLRASVARSGGPCGCADDGHRNP